jgi:hypothetical protein
MSNTDCSRKINVGNVAEIEFEDEMFELGVVYNIVDEIASLVMFDGTVIEEADLSSLKYKFRNVDSYNRANLHYS